MAKDKGAKDAGKGGGGKGKKEKGGGGGGGKKGEPAKMPKTPPRMKLLFENEVRAQVGEKFGIKNIHAIPRPVKVVLNMGIGDAHDNKNLLETLRNHLSSIANQRSVVTIARRSIAGFKVREGWPVGCKVTLRKNQMWYFLDKLISLALPRVRDFRGVSRTAFDKAGNYSLGLTEQGLFPEINMDKVDQSDVHGLHVTVVFENSDAEKSRHALELLGMPFRREEAEAGRRGR